MESEAIRLIINTAFNPHLVGTLYLLLTHGPERIRLPLQAALASQLSEQAIARLVTTLKWLAIAGLVARVNQRLNQWARKGVGVNIIIATTRL